MLEGWNIQWASLHVGFWGKCLGCSLETWYEGSKCDVYISWRQQTEGLIVARLYTHARVHLIVAVKEALVLLPISYLVRIANYQVSWKLVLGKDQFIMTGNWGDNVPVTDDEDLTFLSKLHFERMRVRINLVLHGDYEADTAPALLPLLL